MELKNSDCFDAILFTCIFNACHKERVASKCFHVLSGFSSLLPGDILKFNLKSVSDDFHKLHSTRQEFGAQVCSLECHTRARSCHHQQASHRDPVSFQLQTGPRDVWPPVFKFKCWSWHLYRQTGSKFLHQRTRVPNLWLPEPSCLHYTRDTSESSYCDTAEKVGQWTQISNKPTDPLRASICHSWNPQTQSPPVKYGHVSNW